MEVIDVTEHGDGSATYEWNLTDNEKVPLAEIGIKVLIYCCALDISTEDLWKMLDEKVEEHK